jgi:uncharacterized membrane protein YjfL (UPF0719 family)
MAITISVQRVKTLLLSFSAIKFIDVVSWIIFATIFMALTYSDLHSILQSNNLTLFNSCSIKLSVQGRINDYCKPWKFREHFIFATVL